MASVFKPAGSRKYVVTWRDKNGKPRKKTAYTDKAATQ